MLNDINNLNKKIISCRKCTRLTSFRKKIIKHKRKQFINVRKVRRRIKGAWGNRGNIY